MRIHLPVRAASACAATAALLALSACQSQAEHQRDHWTGYYVGPSMSRAFLTYDAENDGSYRDFQWRKKKSIELTLRRHFFNHNPENPFEADDPTYYEPRPPHSLLPAPWQYIHVEGIVLGAATLAMSPTFFPLPIDSIIGTFEDGGGDEFMDGVGTTVRPIGQMNESFLHDALGFPEQHGDAWRH
jgi:hypothetical protein